MIWGTSDDNTLGEDAKVIILATGIDNRFLPDDKHDDSDEEYYNQIIAKLYREPLLSQNAAAKKKAEKTPTETEMTSKAPESGKQAEDKDDEAVSPTIPFDMTCKGTEAKEVKKETAPKTETQEAEPAKPDEKAASATFTDDAHHKIPSFLDKLKGHLKRGLTVLTSDLDE